MKTILAIKNTDSSMANTDFWAVCPNYGDIIEWNGQEWITGWLGETLYPQTVNFPPPTKVFPVWDWTQEEFVLAFVVPEKSVKKVIPEDELGFLDLTLPEHLIQMEDWLEFDEKFRAEKLAQLSLWERFQKAPIRINAHIIAGKLDTYKHLHGIKPVIFTIDEREYAAATYKNRENDDYVYVPATLDKNEAVIVEEFVKLHESLFGDNKYDVRYRFIEMPIGRFVTVKEGTIWYLASYMDKPIIPEPYKQFHPFGPAAVFRQISPADADAIQLPKRGKYIHIREVE